MLIVNSIQYCGGFYSLSLFETHKSHVAARLPVTEMSASSIGPTTDSSDKANPPARISQTYVCNTCGKFFKSDNELSLHKTLDHKP
jgi:hypothetical protein